MVLATYLYKLTNKLGTPSYHLMAAVAVVLICITIPLVMLQRRLMRTANRFVTMKGKASQARALPLGKWRWVAGAVVVAWLTVTIGVPLLGVALRAFISNWGVGVSLWDELSLRRSTISGSSPTCCERSSTRWLSASSAARWR
ncbi:Ferric iron ABC transporter [Klebsiella pneumoniae]|nr:Ferric iron ABC transporter [Klebsiella pneumoniae]